MPYVVLLDHLISNLAYRALHKIKTFRNGTFGAGLTAHDSFKLALPGHV